MSRRKNIFWSLCAVLLVPVVCLMVWGFVFQPLKYRYLIWRVESARTASEERKAFQIANDWAANLEVDQFRPQDVVSNRGKISGNWLLKLEWLDSSPFGGGAYVVYRSVIDTNNLQVFRDK